MKGKIRIERQPGITDRSTGKAVYIPAGRRFALLLKTRSSPA
ncbi:hypothetical protein [Acidocella sp.]|jgi:hypothetical protein